MNEQFFWFPILQKLQGKKPISAGGIFGYIDGIWIEFYNDNIYAFPDYQTRHAISLKEAKIIYNSKSQVFQPTLFEM